MLCSFLQFGICRALEYLISHLITLASSAETRQPYQGRGWDFVKIFSISERLTQQWNVSLWNYINNHHYVSAVCLLQSTVPPMDSLATFSSPWLFACEAALSGRSLVPGQCGRVTRAAASRGGGWPESPCVIRVAICIQIFKFLLFVLKFVPWLVLLFSHYDTFLGRQNFSHLPHKTLLQIQILKACGPANLELNLFRNFIQQDVFSEAIFALLQSQLCCNPEL